MTWNRRIIKAVNEAGAWYRIAEVMYDEHGRIEMWTEEPIAPLGKTLTELREDIALNEEAFKAPVLEEKDGTLIECNDRI